MPRKKMSKADKEFMKGIREMNKDIRAEFDKKPMFLLRGLRKDAHYGFVQQDEIEETVLFSEEDIEYELKNMHSSVAWKEVHVYKLSAKPVVYLPEDIKKLKSKNRKQGK